MVIYFYLGSNISVEIASISTTSLTLSWTLPKPPLTITNYTISYTNINNTDCFIDSNHITDITTTSDETMYTLTGLQEDTQYSINVTVVLSNEEVIEWNLFMATMADGR